MDAQKRAISGLWNKSSSYLANEWKRLFEAKSLLRVTPFDTSTEQGRSKERYRRILVTGTAAFAARAASAAVSFVAVPITLHYLGTERYGLWMTISSTIALLSFADLGMGNGLLNAVAEADGEDDVEAARKYVSSAFFMLLVIGISIVSVFLAAYSFVPWARVFNVETDLAIRESGPAVAVLIASFAINMPLGIAQRVQLGYQEGFKNYVWQITGSILGLGGILLVVYLRAGLPWLVLAMAGGPVIGALLNCVVLFGLSRPWLLPRPAAFNWAAGKKIAGTGAWFLILQVLTFIGSSSDNLVIAQVMGASAVATYAVTRQMFAATQIAQYFITPLWPAFGEAMARSDSAWARRTLNRALVVSLGASAAIALPLVVFGDTIIALWTRSDIDPSTLLLVGLGLWTVLAGFVGVMSTFLNSGRLLSRQVVFFGAASILALGLKIVLTNAWGVSGVIWATVIGYGTLYVIPALWVAYGALGNSGRRDPISAVKAR